MILASYGLTNLSLSCKHGDLPVNNIDQGTNGGEGIMATLF